MKRKYLIIILLPLLLCSFLSVGYLSTVNASIGYFGYATAGTAQAGGVGMIIGNRWQATATGNITSISIYQNASSGHFSVGVYSDNSNYPDALLINATEAFSTTGSWKTIPLNIAVTEGTYYWLSYHMLADSTNAFYYYSAGGETGQLRYKLSTADYPDPFPSSAGQQAWKLSIYANYVSISGNEDILVLGDSITKGDDVDTPYPASLETLLSRNVDNAANNSIATGTILSNWDIEKTVGFNTLMMLAGVNDLQGAVPTSTTKNNFYTICYDAINNYGMDVFILTITPYHTAFWTEDNQTLLENINAWMKTNLTDIGATVIDAYTLLNNATNNGNLADIYDDGSHIHLSQYGHDILANYIYSIMEPTPSPTPSVTPFPEGAMDDTDWYISILVLVLIIINLVLMMLPFALVRFTFGILSLFLCMLALSYAVPLSPYLQTAGLLISALAMLFSVRARE